MLADEEVRAVQKELRKRHLFLGDSTGEISPALTAAIRRYQEIKGFARTGVIDPETSASLGIAGHTVPATTPFVIDNNGDGRGANGEALPGFLPARWAADEGAAQFEYFRAHPDSVPAAFAKAENEKMPGNKAAGKRRPAAHFHAVQPRKATNPFLQSIDRARKFLFGSIDAKKKRRTGKRL